MPERAGRCSRSATCATPSPTRSPTRLAWLYTTSLPPAMATRLPMPSSRTPLSAGGTVALRRARHDNLIPILRAEASMHTLSIPQSVIDRVIERRGREHVYEDLNPAKTALVVVDMQNAFMLPGVAHALCPMAEKIVPNINRLAQAVRETGGTVVWIKTTFKDDALQNWSTYFEMVTPQQRAKRIEALTADSKGHQLWADLDVRAEDVIVEKNRFSAFIQGSSNLAEVLRARGIDTILITGTVTNVCCESTARDAMMLNFKTIMVTDGNAAVTDEDHNGSLRAFYLMFGDIVSTDMLITWLARNARWNLAAAE